MAKPKTPRAPISFKEPRFFTARHRLREDGLTITLPREVAEYLGAATGRIAQLYFIAIDGTIQISADIPTLAIPVSTARADGFVPQKG